MKANNMNETETQIRLRRATEALAAYRSEENEARKALAAAVESTRKAKEKMEELFARDQAERVKQLEAEYNHCTK